jgi:hypothetical protein
VPDPRHAKTVTAAAKRLSRATGAATVTAIVEEGASGRAAVTASWWNLTSDQMLSAARALLQKVEEDSAKTATACPGCAERWTRARTARLALDGDGDSDGQGEPARQHLH